MLDFVSKEEHEVSFQYFHMLCKRLTRLYGRDRLEIVGGSLFLRILTRPFNTDFEKSGESKLNGINVVVDNSVNGFYISKK